MAYLYYSPYAYAMTDKVNGFDVTPLGNYHLEDVWRSDLSVADATDRRTRGFRSDERGGEPACGSSRSGCCQSIPVVFGVTIVVFFMVHLLPGNPAPDASWA